MTRDSNVATAPAWAASSGLYVMPCSSGCAFRMAVSCMVARWSARFATSCTPVARFFGSFFARRMRSFSSASDRRVYTGSANAGSWRRASSGSASPARHAACSASNSPRPVGIHNSAGSAAPQPSNNSPYFFSASPQRRRAETCGHASPSAGSASAMAPTKRVSPSGTCSASLRGAAPVEPKRPADVSCEPGLSERLGTVADADPDRSPSAASSRAASSAFTTRSASNRSMPVSFSR